MKILIPMGHHLETPSTDRINDLRALIEIGDLKFLLKKN